MPITLRRYLDQHPSSWVSFLEAVSKTLNYLLGFAGLGMVAYAIDTFVNAGQPEPVHSEDHSFFRASAPLLPWNVYAFAGAGLVTIFTAMTAVVGATYRSIPLMNSSIVLLSLLLAAQLCLVVAAFADSESPHSRPARQELRTLLLGFRWVGLAIALLEVLTLMSSCLLQAAYTSALEAMEDMQDELGSSRPLLRDHEAGGAAGRSDVPPRIQRSDSWSERMRTQYGLDTSVLTYNPQAAAARRAAGSAAQPSAAAGVHSAAPARRCTIM